MELTTIAVDRETRARLGVLAGGAPVGSWLREHTKSLLNDSASFVGLDVLKLLVVKLKSYRDVEVTPSIWPEYRDLALLVLPAAAAADAGKRAIDDSCYDAAIAVVELSNMPDEYKRDLETCLEWRRAEYHKRLDLAQAGKLPAHARLFQRAGLL